MLFLHILTREPFVCLGQCIWIIDSEVETLRQQRKKQRTTDPLVLHNRQNGGRMILLVADLSRSAVHPTIAWAADQPERLHHQTGG